MWTVEDSGDSAAIFYDGKLVPISRLLEILNRRDGSRPRVMVMDLPTYEQCAARVDAGNPTELERFIKNNDPRSPADKAWRTDLCLVLSEAIDEDRWAAPERAVLRGGR